MKTRRHNLKQRLVSEAIGTGFLVAAVVGSGIMGERLAGGNGAVALLVNTIATGAALVALICTFGPISGAHLNPAVSLACPGTHPRPTRAMEVLCCSASLWRASDFCALSGDARGCAQA